MIRRPSERRTRDDDRNGSSVAPRVHRVIAELDARGEIDSHAAMCLGHAIREGRTSAFELVLVDLRDLTAINPAGLELFRVHNADCRADGLALGVLISGGERHDQLAEAFVLAGLADTLHYSDEPCVAPPPDLVALHPRALAARARRLAPAGARRAPRRERRSRAA